MKSSREAILPTSLSRILAVGLAVVLVLMPVHAFISTWGGTAIGPLWLWKSWKELVLGALALVTFSWVLWDKGARKVIFRDRLAQAILAYVALSLVLAFVNIGQVGAAATSAGLAMNLRYLVIAFIAYVLFRFAKWDFSYVKKKALMFLVIAGVALAVLGVLQVMVLPRELLTSFGYEKHVTIAPFMTIDENQAALRAFATLRGPNDYGAFLILPLVAGLLFLKRVSWKLTAGAIISAGLFVSVSRSAWIGAVLAIVTMLALTYGSAFLRSKKFVYSAIVTLGALLILIVAATSVPALRLAIFRSSPGDSSLTEGSTDQHLLSTAGGIMRVRENPLGCGVGCSGPASFYGNNANISENYYVQIAEEVGVVGLALWLVIVGLVAKRLYAERQDLLARSLLAALVGISSIGLLLHVWSDDPLSLTWWGLAGATLGYYASVRVKKIVR